MSIPKDSIEHEKGRLDKLAELDITFDDFRVCGFINTSNMKTIIPAIGTIGKGEGVSRRE